MSKFDNSGPGPGGNGRSDGAGRSDRSDRSDRADAPDAFEDTVVEILSIGDESGDEGPVRSASPRADSRPAEAAGSAPLAEQLAAEKERGLRLRADFDNYRKRTERERADVERFALSESLRDLLPVVDNLERALAAQNAQSDAADLKKGVEMIVRQFQEVLKRYGLTPISALGERFDPAIHEAVFHEESGDVTTPTVSLELQRGYRLNDRLLRPALVKVSVPRESTDQRPPVDPAE